MSVIKFWMKKNYFRVNNKTVPIRNCFTSPTLIHYYYILYILFFMAQWWRRKYIYYFSALRILWIIHTNYLSVPDSSYFFFINNVKQVECVAVWESYQESWFKAMQCTGIGFKKQRKKLTKISSFKFLKEDISDLQFFGQMFLFLCFFFVSPTWKI